MSSIHPSEYDNMKQSDSVRHGSAIWTRRSSSEACNKTFEEEGNSADAMLDEVSGRDGRPPEDLTDRGFTEAEARFDLS